jgi:two-component system response regulator PilR (NtrC family)
MPFVPVNCGAIPETLVESELFGYKKGAFTGAVNDSLGLCRRAEGGTLFLDEIGELPLLMQTKLLRLLQEKTVRPVGGDTDIPINVRIVAATNRNLRKEIEKGGFREDLYYRLNVINIVLPSLRERMEDIPLLVSSILRRNARAGQVPVVTPGAMQLLMAHAYPGNVRELENIIERAVVLGGDVILAEHLPETLRGGDQEPPVSPKRETTIIVADDIRFPVNLDTVLNELERRYLLMALEQTKGARKKAAELLGINFRSFRYRLQKFRIGGEDDAR